MRVLMIDDDQELGPAMQPVLERYGIDLDLAFSPSQGFEKLEGQAYEVLLLDMMLPEQDGMMVCHAIRTGGQPYGEIPIIALTARAGLTDRIVALESGFDDFVAKPMEMRELVARITAVTRRRRKSGSEVPQPAPRPMNSRTPAPDTLVLLLSEANLSASFGPYRVNLTELELQVLKTLQAEHGRFLNRSEILGRLGYDRETDPAMIDTVIYRIRQKFRRAGLMEDFIKTLRGQGYSIKAAEQK